MKGNKKADTQEHRLLKEAGNDYLAASFAANNSS